MNSDMKKMAAIAIVLIAVMAGGALVYTKGRDAEKRARADAIAQEHASTFERPHSRSLGPDDARVTLTEFFDPECESCRAIHPGVKELLKRYPKNLRLVVRYFPLHANSVYAATALEAAGEQGKYWEMLDALFHYQPIWGSHHKPRPELIPVYADEIGLDMAAFEASMKKEIHATRIGIDRADGKKLEVRGTPTFFVNGRRLLSLDYSALVDLVEDELGR